MNGVKRAIIRAAGLAALLCVLLPATAKAETTLPETCIPVPVNEASWYQRLTNNLNQIAKSNGAIDLVFIGDSITRRWESTGQTPFKELRKTYSVLNAGYEGDRTQHVLWRITEGKELDGYEAKCIMLTIGTNNTGTYDISFPNLPHDDPEDTAAGIKAILEAIKVKQPKAKVLLLAIFPA